MAADPAAPLPVVEWALGLLGRQIDAAWINAPAAAAIEAVLVEVDAAAAASAARATPEHPRALRLAGASAGASPLEREYAALFEPMRQARAAALAFALWLAMRRPYTMST